MLLTIPAIVYHADMCGGIDAAPCLSNSFAKTMLAKSPLHAMLSHPKLNPDFQERECETKFSVGTAVHALFLEGEDVMGIVDAADWRTKAAKENRDDLYAAGKIPVLRHQYYEIKAMVAQAHKALAACDDLCGISIAGGQSEGTLLWQDGDVSCKARLDWYMDGLILDVKTTDIQGGAAGWMRSVASNGYDIQSAFYKRGIEKATGKKPRFVFIVIETAYPYEVFFCELSQAWDAVGEQKVLKALKMFDGCMKSGEWMGYPKSIQFAEPPNYAITDAENIAAEMDDAVTDNLPRWNKDAPGSMENFMAGKVRDGK